MDYDDITAQLITAPNSSLGSPSVSTPVSPSVSTPGSPVAKRSFFPRAMRLPPITSLPTPSPSSSGASSPPTYVTPTISGASSPPRYGDVDYTKALMRLVDTKDPNAPWYSKMWDNVIFKNIFYVFLGLTLGTVIDQIVSKIKPADPDEQKQKRAAWGRIVLQLFINVVLIATAETYIPAIANDWINTNAGMFFPAMFFAVQFNFFQDWSTNVHKLW